MSSSPAVDSVQPAQQPPPSTSSPTSNNPNTEAPNANGETEAANAALLQLQAAAAAAIAATQDTSMSTIDQNQLITFLKFLPKIALSTGLKDAAEEAISSIRMTQAQMSQDSSSSQPTQQLPSQSEQSPNSNAPPPDAQANYLAYSHHPIPGISDPGPSSHPHGPPGMGLSVTIPNGMGGMPSAPMPMGAEGQGMGLDSLDEGQSPEGGDKSPEGKGRGGRRAGAVGANGVVMGSEEWSRQRKDNHKEVERRRRSNINSGINELARIVPNGSGEKAKGAILSRACQYIHHLKENEARNIEKWTLEKLLMDQAMGDLQAQLEDVKRAWEEERRVRGELERRVGELEGREGGPNGEAGKKRGSEGREGNAVAAAGDETEPSNKRPRIE